MDRGRRLQQLSSLGLVFHVHHHRAPHIYIDTKRHTLCCIVQSCGVQADYQSGEGGKATRTQKFGTFRHFLASIFNLRLREHTLQSLLFAANTIIRVLKIPFVHNFNLCGYIIIIIIIYSDLELRN